jgi:adenylate cyclase
MAIFGAPFDLADGAFKCVKTALEMRDKLAKLNDKWKKENRPQIQVGFGINTGEAIVGNIGSERRMEYTAIGDMVNVASRVEGETEGGQIFITEDTYKELGSRVTVKKFDSVKLKGKTLKVQIFEVTGLNPNP